MDIGSRIVRWRELRGMSQAELARRVGVTRSTACRWEGDRGKAGTNTPKMRHVERIAKVLGVTMAKFYATTLPKSRRRSS